MVSALSIVLAAATYLIASRLLLGRGDLAGRVIGTLCSAYSNASNLGLPIAAYVLGDMTWMAPIMLIQVGLLQPTALALLDLAAARRAASTHSDAVPHPSDPQPDHGGHAGGSRADLAGTARPGGAPIEMISQVAVPAMLLAFGVSLRPTLPDAVLMPANSLWWP